MNKRKIVYISKYALTPANAFSGRQFFMSKNFSLQGYRTILISSFSCGFSTDLNDYTRKNNGVFYKMYDTLEHFLIPGKEIKLGFNFKRMFTWIQFELRLFRFLKNIVLHKNDVIIVSSLSLLTIINGIIIKRKTGCNLVFEVRDIWPLTLIDIGGMSRFNPFILFLSLIEKIGYNYADLIVGTMPGLNLHVNSRIRKKFEFLYIPMGFDENSYGENSSVSHKNTNKEGKFVACYAGAIGKVNRVDDILKAASIIEKSDANVYFRIIGSGPLLEKLKSQYKKLSNVEFMPWLSKSDLKSELLNADLLLHPVPKQKIYRFGISPNKWIDYMQSGKPILVAYEGHNTILHEANCAIFCSPENPESIAQGVLDIKNKDINELVSLGSNGRDFLIQRLNYKVLSKKFIDKVEELF